MSVTWTLNGNSRYEISSKEHLLQLMNKGSLYTDAGSPPAEYFTSDYEQTVDIDLNADANILPIGLASDQFSGSYDGGNFSISNWSYDGSSAGQLHTGLFGSAIEGTLENIKLRGVWVCSGNQAVGFFGGSISPFYKTPIVRNVDCIFDEGSTLSKAGAYYGALVGSMSGTSYAITVKGTINTVDMPTGVSAGGIFGERRGSSIGLRNLASWPDGLTGSTAGGIVGLLHQNSNITYAMNAMVGDITGTVCGGIVGHSERGSGTDPFSQVLNSMNGNITATSWAGGIVGKSYGNKGNFGPFDVMNYMTGDIVCTNNASGGIIGQAYSADSSKTVSISNTINAMNGAVDDAIFGATTAPTSGSAKIDTSFGLTYTTATYGSTSDTFTGTTSTLLPELSYTAFVFTDNASNSYEYDMVFGNVGGHSSYAQYTHAIISKGDVSGPYVIDFDGNTTEYLTYINVDSKSAFIDASLVVTFTTAAVVYDYTGTTILFGAVPVIPSLIPFGAVMYVNAAVPESYVSGATVMNDLSGSSLAFESKNSQALPEAPGGGIDFTPVNNSLKLSSALSVQTISLWFKKADFSGTTLLDLRELNDGVVGESAQIENGNVTGNFFTQGTVYLNGIISTHADVGNSPDDELINVVYVGGYPSASTRLTLFANLGQSYTYPTTFLSALFYDRALSAQEILDNYDALLELPAAELAIIPPLTVTPRPISVSVVVGPVNGATAYRLTSQVTGSTTERIVKSNFVELNQKINNLTPGTEYTFRLYSTTGNNYDFVDESTVTTLINSASNYDTNDFLVSNGRFDLSAFDSASVEFISDNMNDIFTTGDSIDIAVRGRGTKVSKFVNRGGNVSLSDSEALVAPFSKDAGAGQSVTLTLSDSSIVALAYDETTEAITVGTTSYNSGDSFVLDGKKATIVDI